MWFKVGTSAVSAFGKDGEGSWTDPALLSSSEGNMLGTLSLCVHLCTSLGETVAPASVPSLEPTLQPSVKLLAWVQGLGHPCLESRTRLGQGQEDYGNPAPSVLTVHSPLLSQPPARPHLPAALLRPPFGMSRARHWEPCWECGSMLRCPTGPPRSGPMHSCDQNLSLGEGLGWPSPSDRCHLSQGRRTPVHCSP